MKKELFVCVHNSGRSQMAEALFKHYAAGKAQALSAGTQPACHIDRNVVEAMSEVGIDISDQRSKMLIPKMLEDADRVITMGYGVEGVCPATFIPVEDWQLDDPEGKSMEEVGRIRDETKAKVVELARELQ